MARIPAWLPRLPIIIAKLEKMRSPLLNRAAVEQLFRVRRRQALILMHRFAPDQTGTVLVVNRISLIRILRDLAMSKGLLSPRPAEQRSSIPGPEKVIEDAKDSARRSPFTLYDLIEVLGKLLQLPVARDVKPILDAGYTTFILRNPDTLEEYVWTGRRWELNTEV